MPQPLVLITEPITTEPTHWLSDRCRVLQMNPDDPAFDEALKHASGMVVRTYTRVDQALLDKAPDLKVVGRAGVGLDNIDLDACALRGVRVVHTPHSNAMAVVEYMVSMLIGSLRVIEPMSKPFNNEQWHSARESAITPGSVVGTRIGIIGLGHIGSRVARAAQSLGMEVVYHDLQTIDPEIARGFESVSLDELLRTSRCICLHVDGRPENRHLINERAFGLMRNDGVLINASRGIVVDPVAAEEFARSNPSARLVLDVHDPEPIALDSGLFGLENVVLTPHIAAATAQAKSAMSWVVRDVWEVLQDQEPEHPAR